jgi:hypothetical protein
MYAEAGRPAADGPPDLSSQAYADAVNLTGPTSKISGAETLGAR